MNKHITGQVIPIFIAILTFLSLWVVLYFFIIFLNLLPVIEQIKTEINIKDILIGLTIYLKTSIDFGIFIGNLMRSNPGWKKRVAIEIGTAFGNGLGTIVVLIIWSFFKEVPIMMAVMIFFASLVLLRMAEDSFVELIKKDNNIFTNIISIFHAPLLIINKFFNPIINKIIPHAGILNIKSLPWFKLIIFSLSIPFILGLDDFAGYIPLFSVVNIYGFSIGVFLGHMLLSIALFISPKKTVEIVSAPLIMFIGGFAFIIIALWGFYEVIHLLSSIIF